MADNNLSVEKIIEQYSNRSRSKSSSDFDVDAFLESLDKGGRKTAQKTEMIEDVLEIGDNSLVVQPAEEYGEQGGSDAPSDSKTSPSDGGERVLKANPASVGLTAPRIKPQIDREAVSPEPIEGIRVGEAMSPDKINASAVNDNKPADGEAKGGSPAAENAAKGSQSAQSGTEPDKKPQDAPKKPHGIRPVEGKNSDESIMNELIRLKNERGTRKPVQKQAPPVNRASIGDIDLNLGKKVIPNTEMGIDENASEEEKLAYLNAKRRERVKQLVEEEEEQKEPSSPDEFERFDQADKKAASIAGLKASLIARLCILLVTGLVSGYLTVAKDIGLPVIQSLIQTNTFLFVNVVLGLAASFVVSLTVMRVGIVKLFTMKADSDSLAAVSTIFAIISAIALLGDTELAQTRAAHVYICAAIFGLFINTVGKLLIITRTERNFKYVSGGYSKYAAVHIDDDEIASKFTKGALTDFPSLATSRKTEFVRDFIKNSYSADMTDSFCRLFVPIITGIALLIGVVSFFTAPEQAALVSQKLLIALANASGVMTVCSCAGMMLVTNIPLARASKKYLQSSAVMLGYSAVEQFSDVNSVLVDAVDLFPDGMVEIVNLKPARNYPIEEGILFAASLCCQTESILKPAFYKMIRGKTDMLYAVESYICEDGLGISGWIENKRVLFGNRTLMESHSIEGLPTPQKEAEYSKGDGLVYLSIGGHVAMIFIVRTIASVSVSRALRELERQGVTVILRSVDSLLSITRLSELFNVSPNCFKLLPFRYHSEYDSQTSYVDEVSSPMVFSGRFESLIMLIIGAKRLQRSAAVGVTVQVLSAVIGVVLCAIFAILGSFGTVFSGTVALCYLALWTLITALCQTVLKA